jgi:hypothetical protein
MRNIQRTSVGLAPAALFVSLFLATGSLSGQENEEGCRLPKEESGLIRGDRVPSGCLLLADQAADSSSPTYQPFLISEETIFFTPNAKVVVLENGFRLSRGRLVVPVVSAEPTSSIDFGSGSGRRGFSPLQRPMGPLQRHFGPLERDFGRPAARPAPRGRGSGKP